MFPRKYIHSALLFSFESMKKKCAEASIMVANAAEKKKLKAFHSLRRRFKIIYKNVLKNSD